MYVPHFPHFLISMDFVSRNVTGARQYRAEELKRKLARLDLIAGQDEKGVVTSCNSPLNRENIRKRVALGPPKGDKIISK
jgi:hypothetical protein